MKCLKDLGLAIVSVLSLLAVGAVPASADEVCTNTAVNCAQISTMTISQVGTGVLATTGGTTLVTCNAGDIHLSVKTQGSSVDPISGEVDTLNFTECTATVTTLANGTFDASTVGTNGTIAFTGSQVTVHPIFGASCVYGSDAAVDIGTTSGTSFHVTTTLPRSSGGFTCPADILWTASYDITNHTLVDWRNN